MAFSGTPGNIAASITRLNGRRAEADDARGTGTHAGRPAQHHPQEQCQPKGLAARASNRKAREITDRKKYSSEKARRVAGLFLLRRRIARPISVCKILAAR